MAILAGCNLDIPSSISLTAGDAATAPVVDATVIPPCIDTDGDGVCAAAGDCNDLNPLIRPGLEEDCNGIDDDCDQAVDEDVGEGEECLVFGDECTLEGVRVCDPMEGLICEVIRDPEVCNGTDDDCDGSTDEGNPGGGAPCDAGGGVGACGAGTFVCSSGTLGCLPNATPGSATEECGGTDEDCDGRVDEFSLGVPLSSSCYGGLDATKDIGRCHSGSWQCLDGRFGSCVGEQRPTAPHCNSSEDWDCNGEPDNNQDDCVCTTGSNVPCYGGPPGTLGIGLCTGGTQTCAANVWSTCSTHITPAAELCDGLDNDCNGTVDNGFEVGEDFPCTVGLGACTASGVRECAPDGLSARCSVVPGTPVNENADACNGVDDDCDGRIDEALAGAGGLCDNGLLGPCARTGALVCDLEAEDFVCNAPLIVGTAEVCNDIDDDCDGTVDDGFPNLGQTCTVGVGACSRAGEYICSPILGTEICSVQAGGPSPEVCDGLDNDCDGSVDEGFGVGNACVAPGICGAGVLECTPVGQTRCSSGPGGSTSLAGSDTCDGLDNDCDGLVDESYQYNLGQECWGCMAVPGIYECAGNGAGITCSTSANASDTPPEICGDSYDNDCDGQTDEVECDTP